MIRHHPRKGQYPVAYLNYVRTVLQKPRKLPGRQPAVRQFADYLFKCITGKLLLDEHRLNLLPPVVEPASTRHKALALARLAAPTEPGLFLGEVRDIYEAPGPIAKLNERTATFEEHRWRTCLTKEFVLQIHDNQDVLVLPM